MPTTTIDGRTIHVNDEGFLTDPDEWTEPLATTLAAQIGIELTDEHWEAIHFLRDDYAHQRRRRHPDQDPVPAVPPEARQEARVRRGPAQAPRLRVKERRP